MNNCIFAVVVTVALALPLNGREVNAKCHSPPDVKSARKTSTAQLFHEGDCVNYACDNGFDAIGPVKADCGHDGKWSKPRFGCNKCYGHWTLIFRAKGGIGGKPSQIYMDSDIASEKDKTVPVGCSSRNTAHDCKSHYRSSLIDDWGLLKIKKVKLELLTGEGQVAHLVFNGIGSTSVSWLAKDRVLSSSWGDIKTSPSNFFSIFGHRDGGVARRFFLSTLYNGCSGDKGWMVMVEATGVCPVDKQKKYPAILYSPWTASIIYNGFVEADVMAIYIEADDLCD